MPSKTKKQHNFMAMASTPEGRAKLADKGIDLPPVSVAREFVKADKGKRLPKRM